MNLSNYLNQEQLELKAKDIKKIFFFRVCGTGMGAAACLLKENGFLVEGVDSQFYPPMGDYLKTTGIKLHHLQDFNWNILNDFDLIIVGNVVPRGSEDAIRIESLGIPFTSFPTAIGTLALKDRHVVGVAGTHGKTTTTYFLTQLLETLNQKPGHFIGGVMEDRAPSSLGKSNYFIIESDEYDSAYFEKFSKFRSYFIDDLILTSLEFDHGDIFNSIDDIKKEFIEVAKNLKGINIVNNSYQAIMDLIDDNLFTNSKLILYGDIVKNTPHVLEMDKNGTEFIVDYKKEKLKFTTNVVGVHNILNITACILYLLEKDFSYDDINIAVKNLKLVKRRQEVRGLYKGSVIIDDFAHHPRAVKLTIESVKKLYPDKKIKVYLEPASATARSSFFQDQWKESLTESDRFVLVQPKSTTIKKFDNLDCHKVVEESLSSGTLASVAHSLDELRLFIDRDADESSVILILSNSTCMGLWESDFSTLIEKNSL